MESIPQGKQWINGEWLPGNGQTWSRRNPFCNSIVWQGNWGSLSQADDAMGAASDAFESWSHNSLSDRTGIVKQFATLLGTKRSELNRLIVSETGKPSWEADTETSAAIGKVQNSIEALHQRRSMICDNTGDPASIIRYRPLGAMVVLGPFNLPAHLPGAHMVPALLAGNTIVFKPSEQTPGVGEFLARTWKEAGVPQGVVNLVHGTGEVAQRLINNPACSGVLFTGSYRVGKLLHQALAGRPEVMLALELGGNNPLIVDRTESIDAAVYQIILSAYITSGQRCTCARRLILTRDGSGERVLERLAEVLPLIDAGDPDRDPPPFLGTLISEEASRKMLDLQSKWIEEGGREIRRMEPLADHLAALSPGLIEYDDPSIYDEEWFGPLLAVQRANDLDDAIGLANRTKFGLSAGLISDDVEAFHHVVNRIRAGIVNWNRQTTGASGKLPFGGVGTSGNFRPSGSFAADYCSYPIASLESPSVPFPAQGNPGLEKVLEYLKR